MKIFLKKMQDIENPYGTQLLILIVLTGTLFACSIYSVNVASTNADTRARAKRNQQAPILQEIVEIIGTN